MNIHDKLSKYHQEHLLKFEPERSEAERKALYAQIESLDFDVIRSAEAG